MSIQSVTEVSPAATPTQGSEPFIIGKEDRILVTGAAGFIGSRVVQNLLKSGFRNIVCLVRSSTKLGRIEELRAMAPESNVEVVQGNLLRASDCEAAFKDVSVVLHLAAGTGEKSFPDAFMNTVVTTRNLLDAVLRQGRLRQFVLVSSFSVYSNCDKPNGRLLDESSPLEKNP
jgi:nucleoside-diphosphate-sugar epimerase